MKVTQITPGRFHHFHLARQLEKKGLLESIYTGYPKFKLSDELDIERSKIKTFPWLQTLYMSKGKIGLGDWEWFSKELAWLCKVNLDNYVAKSIKKPTHLIALSGSGIKSGLKTKELGGKYICDRGSAHIRYQETILQEEYKRFGIQFKGIDPRIIAREEEEYEASDFITIPSEFSKQSFIKLGIKSEKLIKIPYGANLKRFKQLTEPSLKKFTVLFVGNVSIQKGIIDLIEAFNLFKHPNKELIIVGKICSQMVRVLSKQNLDKVIFKGHVNNTDLPLLYSESNVFVLPSIQEGLAMVQGEALACGCPVIATVNTGSEDLFTNGKEGFIVPIRNPHAIADKLQLLADSPFLREEMSIAALNKIQNIGGWDDYGNRFEELIKSF